MISITVTSDVMVGSTCSNPLPVEQPSTSRFVGRTDDHEPVECWTLLDSPAVHVADVVTFRYIDPRITRRPAP